VKIADQLDRHRDDCAACQAGSACAAAAALIGQLAEKIAPHGAEEDPRSAEAPGFEAHAASCSECSPRLLCRIGQRMALAERVSIIRARCLAVRKN
jgi:hypothetical protein